MTESRFADWARARMKARRLSQRHVARQAGIDHSAVSRIIASGQDPKWTTAAALYDTLGGDCPMCGSGAREVAP